ncbi:LytR/AlgR family response regulator transcription factor [Massilia sp. S19_KUP03_FR1]|uniref:LytR/AlgR family response regulator transcription factor n=1 Tax=Massilia sp. S19_KUP03_FR1 TaxID=3025503 RepID=UPI002FCCFE09
MRVLIVDDEPLARRNLAVLLARDPALLVVGECGSAESALAAIATLAPDLVFLDIDMPECDGFELLERSGPAPRFALVFVTAHHQFALRAFEVGALDYILKPFDDARFERVLARAKEQLRLPGASARFLIRNGATLEVVKFCDIDWIEASDYYVTLHAGGRAHMLRRSLAELDGLLATHGFQRIHRSAIVNLDRVGALGIGADGEYDVVLASGARLRMSRRYRQAVRDRMAGM